MALEDGNLFLKSATLKELLKELQDDKRYVIGLYGKTGSGKTTLAKVVHDEAKSLNIFDLVLFVTVSQDPDIMEIQDQIAELLNLKFGNKSQYGRAARINLSLVDKKRIFVILDDVPTKFDLEDIGIPCSDKGRCKLLLTTRRKQDCTLMIGKREIRCQTIIPMHPLSDEDTWMLLKKHSGMHDDTTNHRLLNVSKEVALACNKLPGTIIDLGLKKKGIVEWNLLLNSLRHTTAHYHVFLSFCRKYPDSFVGWSLYKELKRKGLKTFLDHELGQGDQISTKTIQAIEASRLSIIVLSENYLGTAQCRDELLHIIKCRKTKKQLVRTISHNLRMFDIGIRRHGCGEVRDELEAWFQKDHNKVEEWESACLEVSLIPILACIERIFEGDYYLKIEGIVDTIIDRKHYLYIQDTETDSDSDDMIEEMECSNANPEGASDQLLMALEDNGLCFNSATLKELSKELQDDSIYIIGLYGQKGSGKTTLVEAVRDKAKSLKIFDVVLFATVSQNPNIRLIQDQIASLLNLKFGKENKLKRAVKIESTLESIKRILVILDDVPAEFDPEDIGIPCNDQQCKFLLTTRSKEDCTLMISEQVTHCQKMIHMRHLSEEDTWKLLQKHSGIEKDDDESSSNPLTVAKEIASKYKWLPGTIKKIGTSLKDKPLKEWEGLLNSLKHSTARYQIFLSFRGLDTRDQFTSSLYDELKRNGFKTFMDDKLKHGDQISTELIKAIEDSRLSIIVLSENYADSAWCLEELVHILKCKETKNQLVWPIFYKVEPTDVRHQTEGVGIAMAKLEGKKDPEKIKIWKDALFKVCGLAGEQTYKQGMSQPKFIQDIIKSANESKNYLYLRSMDME